MSRARSLMFSGSGRRAVILGMPSYPDVATAAELEGPQLAIFKRPKVSKLLADDVAHVTCLCHRYVVWSVLYDMAVKEPRYMHF